jgi:VCBS repeat-containing protein
MATPAQDGDTGAGGGTGAAAPADPSPKAPTAPGDPAGAPPAPGGGSDAPAAGKDDDAGDPDEGMNVDVSGGLDSSLNDGGQASDGDGADGEAGAGGADGSTGLDGAVGGGGAAGEEGADGASGQDGVTTQPLAPTGEGPQNNSDTPPAEARLATLPIPGSDPGTEDHGASAALMSKAVVPMASRFAFTGGQDQQPANAGGQESAFSALADTTPAQNTPQPAAMTSLATTVVGLFFSPFLATGPSAPAPAEPPLLWGLMAWIGRETRRTLGIATPAATTPEPTLILDAVAPPARTAAPSLLAAVAPPNKAPVAYNDPSKVTAEDTPITVPAANGVLKNDIDANRDPLTAELVSQAKHGTVALNSDGSYTYTPAANYYGADTFTYRAYDGVAYSNVATATIAITPTNDAPVGNPDSYVTPINKKLSVSSAAGVLKNDSDVDNPTLTAQLVTGPSNGTVALSPNGAFTYTPNTAFTGIDTFTYRAKDPAGQLSGPTTVSIKVGVNDPVAVNDTDTVAEGATKNVIVLANDTDADGNSSIVPTSVVVTSGPAHGTATPQGDGTIKYVSNGDEVTSDSFTYTVKDTTNAVSNTATVTLTITPVNDAPVGPIFIGHNINEDTPVNASILSGASDAEGDDIDVTVTGTAQHGNFTVDNETGGYSYTPFNFVEGQSVTDTFSYVISDGNGGNLPGTLTFTVAGLNDAPAANDDTATVNADSGANTITVVANDTDIDTGTTGLTITAVDPVSMNGGTVTTNGATVTYTPATDYSGPDSFTYTITDPSGATDTATVNITVADPLDFDSGSLAGWNTGTQTGNQGPTITGSGTGVSVFTGPMTYNAPDGHAWTYTPNGSGAAALSPTNSPLFTAAATSLGLTAAEGQEIATASGGTPTGAAWMTRTVHLEANTEYTMAWNFISPDYTPFTDGSITTLVYQGSGPAPTVLVNNEAKNYALLGFTTAAGDYSTGSYGSTGWQTATYQVSETGDYLLGFAVFNGNDNTLAPVLLVDSQPGTTLRDGQPYTLPPETV